MIESWQKMMTAWCWIVILFGAVLMGGVFDPTAGLCRALFGVIGGAAPAFDAPLRFSVGLMGAVTMGWGLTMLAVTSVSHLLAADVARVLWRRVTAAVAIWFVVDSLISIATGFGLNAVSNTVLLAAFVLIAGQGGLLAAARDERDGKASAR